MTDSDMEISSDSESVSRAKFRDNCASADMVAMIPMPPSNNPTSSNTTSRSGNNPAVTAMPLKKRWRQSLEQEPKKKKVSLEAYRKRRASGGDSGDSLLSTSGTDSASTSAQLKENVKQEHKLARELARQKLSIGELERRKAKLKKALKQIDAAAEASSGPNAAAKNEFDKFTEKQSRWLEKRAREKQREVKLDRFTSSLDEDRPHDWSGPSQRAKRSTVAPDTKEPRLKQREVKLEHFSSLDVKRSHDRSGSGHRHKRSAMVFDAKDPRLKRSLQRQSEVKLDRFSSLDVERSHERNDSNYRHKRNAVVPDDQDPRLKQREDKLGRLSSSLGFERSHERSGSNHRHKRSAVAHDIEDPCLQRSGQKKNEASPAKRSRADFTSTLHCLQKAKEEVQRQLDLLRSPACNSHNAAKPINGFSRLSPRKNSANSPKHSSRK